MSASEPEEQRLPAVAPSAGALMSWDQVREMANALAKSDLVPAHYRNKPANCLLAVDVAQRLNASSLEVMRNSYVLPGGGLGWASKFVVALANRARTFVGPIRYDIDGEGSSLRVVAKATLRETGETIVGPKVTMQMAIAEGWAKDKRNRKTGEVIPSKYKTMPEVMLCYRAASFLINRVCPETTLGMPVADDAYDDAEPREAEHTIIDKLNEEAARRNAPDRDRAEAPSPEPDDGGAVAEVVAEEGGASEAPDA